jgi:Tol biopolymer transport system component
LRAKRVALFCAIIAVLLVGVYLLRFFGDQHRFIDTSGEIVFASDMGSPGKSHIFIVKPDGAPPRQLTTGNWNDIDPSFSPDGSQITFISDRTGSQEVYLMDSDGLGARALSYGTDAKSDPEFAPDGRQIAFLTRGTLSILDSDSGQTNIVLPQTQSITSTTSTQLANAVRAAVISYEWSPEADVNKEQLSAVQQDQDGDLQTVALVPADGGKPNVVVGAPSVTTAWSPDGSKIAVAAIGLQVAQNKAVSGIILYNSDGAIVQQPPLAMVSSATGGPESPAYSPDSSKIVFQVSTQTKLGNEVPQGIFETPSAPGSQPAMMIRGGAHDPRFSPDGSHMLFLGPSPQNPQDQDAYVLDMSNGQAVGLAKGQGTVSSAAWSPALPKKG